MSNLLLASVSPDNDLPSIFELSFLKQMDLLSVNAIDHISQQVLNQSRFPGSSSSSSVRTMLSRLPWTKWIVEILALHFADGLISEAMYGLRRAYVTDDNTIAPLTHLQKAAVFLTEMLMPHLTELGASIHIPEEDTADLANPPANPPANTRLRSLTRWSQRVLKKLSQWTKLIWGILVVWRKLQYIYGSSPFLTPVCDRLRIALLKQRNAVYGSTLNDPHSKEMLAESAPPAGRLRYASMMAFAMSIKLLEWHMRQRREGGANATAETAADVSSPSSSSLLSKLKSLRANFDADGENRNQDGADELILPPKRPPVGEGCISPPVEPGLCPLCDSPLVNPCASSGGYVFCYLCLVQHIREHSLAELRSRQNDGYLSVNHKLNKSSAGQLANNNELSYCPVSGVPCREEDIIRLFDKS